MPLCEGRTVPHVDSPGPFQFADPGWHAAQLKLKCSFAEERTGDWSHVLSPTLPKKKTPAGILRIYNQQLNNCIVAKQNTS